MSSLHLQSAGCCGVAGAGALLNLCLFRSPSPAALFGSLCISAFICHFWYLFFIAYSLAVELKIDTGLLKEL